MFKSIRVHIETIIDIFVALATAVFLFLDISGFPSLMSETAARDVKGWAVTSFIIFCGLMGRRVYELRRTLDEKNELIRTRDVQIDSLQAERNRLDGELTDLMNNRAYLTVFYRREFPMWWEEERWVRVGVRNAGPSQSRDVKVTLERITPNPLSFNVLPAQLGRKDGGTEDCRIDREMAAYFDVFSRTDPQLRTLSLWTVPSAGRHFWLDSNVTYQFRMLVSGENTGTIAAELEVRYPDGGEVEMRLVDISHPVTGYPVGNST